MVLYVRRISQTWAGKYDMFHFIQDTFNGYGVNSFSTLNDLEIHLREYFMDNDEHDIGLMRNDVFCDDTSIWLYVVDTESKEDYAMTVGYIVDVQMNRINTQKD